MRVAVTGAHGMLARALVPRLESAGDTVLALAKADADVTDAAALDAAIAPFRPDWIFHLAAFTKVDACENEPERALAVNGEGSRHVARTARACGAGLLAISTDYVFDGRATRPYREDDPAAPLGAYGRSKWAGEQAIRAEQPRHLIVRTSWLFGRGGPNFVDAILARARSGQPLVVVDDQRGSPTWTHDLAGALVALARRAAPGTYHATNAGDCTWHELAEWTLARAGLDVPIERISTAKLARPAPRPAYSVLDHTKLERAIGERLPHWRQAVEHYLEESAAGAPAARREAS